MTRTEIRARFRRVVGKALAEPDPILEAPHRVEWRAARHAEVKP